MVRLHWKALNYLLSGFSLRFEDCHCFIFQYGCHNCVVIKPALLLDSDLYGGWTKFIVSCFLQVYIVVLTVEKSLLSLSMFCTSLPRLGTCLTTSKLISWRGFLFVCTESIWKIFQYWEATLSLTCKGYVIRLRKDVLHKLGRDIHPKVVTFLIARIWRFTYAVVVKKHLKYNVAIFVRFAYKMLVKHCLTRRTSTPLTRRPMNCNFNCNLLI